MANIYWVLKLQQFIKTDVSQKDQITHLKESLESLNYSTEMQLLIGNLNINTKLINEEGQSQPLNLIQNLEEDVLIVRYGRINCSTCINTYIRLLKEILPDSIVKDRTLFLAKYSNFQELGQFKRLHGVESKIFRKDENLTPLDSMNVPYFFLLNKERDIK